MLPSPRRLMPALRVALAAPFWAVPPLGLAPSVTTWGTRRRRSAVDCTGASAMSLWSIAMTCDPVALTPRMREPVTTISAAG